MSGVARGVVGFAASPSAEKTTGPHVELSRDSERRLGGRWPACDGLSDRQDGRGRGRSTRAAASQRAGLSRLEHLVERRRVAGVPACIPMLTADTLLLARQLQRRPPTWSGQSTCWFHRLPQFAGLQVAFDRCRYSGITHLNWPLPMISGDTGI